MNTQCGTHQDLGQILKDTAKTALQAWYEQSTPANMTAFTTACEYLTEHTVRELKTELIQDLTGTIGLIK